jgi:amino acid transporter
MGADAEKGTSSGSLAGEDQVGAIHRTVTQEMERDPNFWTRNGLNADSFKMKHYGSGIVELERPMKSRHMQMIAIGGSIGAGFFVGSGSALAKGGPASVTIDFLIIGIMIFNVVYALGELAVMYPVSGGFYTYSTRFIDPSWGFAMGWNYVMQWAIVLPFELTVCSLTMQYWDTNEDHVPLWISVWLIAIIIISLFGALGYAEEEFWASTFKLIMTVVFMIIAVVLVCGGGPDSGRYNTYQGAKLWYEPGAFRNGFKGFCSVFVTAAFAFSGTELVGLAAAEAKNPVKSLPSAIKQVFWRITIFYVLGLFFIGLLIPYDDKRLLGQADDGEQLSYAAASPFVLVGKYAGLNGFDHVMNVVILVSVLSIGVSSVYGGSRTLTALAQQGYAPKIFTYIDKSGRPLPSTAIIVLFGFLAYIKVAPKGDDIFNWLLALSGLAALFTWGSICLAHIRFRAAWKAQGHTLDEIPFQAIGGVYGSWLGLTLCVLILIAQIYTAIIPLEGDPNAENFFVQCLALPVVIVFWIAGFLWKRTGWLRLQDIDVDTNRRELDWEEINAFRAKVAQYPAWKRVLEKVF